MSNLLHVSDFHITKNERLSKERLDSLSEFFKKSNINIDILVFSGDLVDGRGIVDQTRNCFLSKYPKELFEHENHDQFIEKLLQYGKSNEVYIDDYNAMLYENTKNAFKRAIDIFNTFLNNLNITDKKRIIICCGNHDIVRPVYLNKTNFKCDSDMSENDETKDFFQFYDYFCSEIGTNISYHTYTREIDGLRFIVINTNFENKSSNKTSYCWDCFEINNILKKRKINSNGNQQNIIVSHQPFDNVCENAHYDYSIDNMPQFKITVFEKLKKCSNYLLCGDKHSYEAQYGMNWNVLLSGAPLNEKRIVYNLIEYIENKGIINTKYLVWNNNTWNIYPIVQTVEKVYNLSKIYINSSSFELLLNKDKETCCNTIGILDDILKEIDSNKIDTISDMFLPCCKLREDGNDLILKENIFNKIHRIIEESKINQPINVRGVPNTGKSTLLGIQFLYLLGQFIRGNLLYIPVYFNLDYIYLNKNIQKNEDDCFIGGSTEVKEIFNKTISEFKMWLYKVSEMSTSLHMPVCVIVDGFDQKQLFSTNKSYNIERRIHQYLEQFSKKYKSKYILSYNNYQIQKVTENKTSDKTKNSQYVLYLNPVHIQSLGYKENRFNIVLKKFLELMENDELRRETNYEIIKNNIVKFRKSCITLEFLNNYYNNILKIKKSENSWDVLEKYITLIEQRCDDFFEQLNDEDYDLLENVAFKLNRKGYTFEQINKYLISKKKDPVPFKYFVIIKNNVEINNYFFAKYYYREFEYYAHKSTAISPNSILFDFIPRDLSILIRLLLDDNKVVYRFIDNHKEELKQKYLYSNILYLMGHLKKDKNNNEYNRCFDIIKNIEKSNGKNKKEKEFFQYCDNRSKVLSQITRNSEKANIDYLNNLIKDEGLRKFNRQYQLYYYGDIEKEVIITDNIFDCENVIQRGFDFSNCFYTISDKITYNFNLKSRYPLIEIDLFTLCDLIYSRLQSVYVTDSTDYSLFYYNKFNNDQSSLAKDILLITANYIETYLKYKDILYDSPIRDYDNIYIYFLEAKTNFINIAEELDNYKNKNNEIPYIYHSKYYDQIISMSKIGRIGWLVNEKGIVHNDFRNIMNNKKARKIETIADHVLSAVYIAFIFLPKKSEIEGYDKEKIIEILLAHEFGKLYIKDFTPNSEDHIDLETKEKTSLLKFLNLSSIDGFANLSELYDIFKDSNDGQKDINYHIAMDINSIQREYKYYKLLLNGIIDFKEERKLEFLGDFKKKSYSSLGIEIRKKLILSNPEFRRFLKK